MTRSQAWIEGARLRTLPISVAGVVMATGQAYARMGQLSATQWGWAAVCLLFALLAQIASNFANEYFDYRDGIDGDGRLGPLRGVAAGVISPTAMKRAAFLTLGFACIVGISTVFRGGLWLIPVGIFIALGALAYSAGPYPLSRHCLGEVAVLVFYGIIPVSLTYYVITLNFSIPVFVLGFGVGLAGAMVILVNNYRDIKSDTLVGKHTLSTVIGPQGSALLYCALGQFAAICMMSAFSSFRIAMFAILAFLGLIGGALLHRATLSAPQLTKLLAITALTLLLTSFLSFF